MHRHGYKGRKLSRETGPRLALIRGQLTSLVLYEQIKTTEAKAREVGPRFDHLVTQAKLRTLAGQRALREVLLTENAVQKMIQELEPAFRERQGGYTRMVKLENRRGDNAPMVLLSLVTEAVGSSIKPVNTKAVTAKPTSDAPASEDSTEVTEVAESKATAEATV